jgi:hypothetical protein
MRYTVFLTFNDIAPNGSAGAHTRATFALPYFPTGTIAPILPDLETQQASIYQALIKTPPMAHPLHS